MWIELKSVLERRRWMMPMLVFAVALLYSGWFWPGLTFPDTDSFYHIKMTELLAHGLVRNFPWLPFTVLGTNFIDHHFLYHVFLFPFVTWLGPFVGAKIATHLLVATVAALFYWILRRLKFVCPLFFTVALFFAPGFLLRMHLAKAPAFSLIFILLGIFFLLRRRAVALGTLAFIYVWAYNAWPLLGFITVVWIVAQSGLVAFLEDGARLRSFFHALAVRDHCRLFFGVCAGTLVGMVINPYFPSNLLFYWHHIVQIGIVNYGSKISVGAEWYPMSFAQLIADNAHLFGIFVLAIVLLVMEARRLAATKSEPPRSVLAERFALTALALVFFLLTVRSRRFIEYFVPFFVLASAGIVTLAQPSLALAWARVKESITTRIAWLQFTEGALIIALLVLFPYQSVFAHRSVLLAGYSPDHFSGAGAWLRAQAPAGSTVFNDEWDRFPILFYQADRLRYITGLDTTFSYEADPARYELWRKAVYGEYAGDVVSMIHATFGARYIFLAGHHDLFTRQVMLSKHTRLLYQDSVSTLYAITIP